MNITIKDYRWPSLAPLVRQMVVIDKQGRYGIASLNAEGLENGVITAHPVDIASEYKTGWRGKGPIILTSTVFNKQEDGTYTGFWFDNNALLVHIAFVYDLGYLMPDQWADIALAGSEYTSHWDYGATLGKVGGELPVKGQRHDEMNVEQALDYAKEVGETITGRGIRKAARSGYIPGARKPGRDWLIPYEGFNHYLDNRPRPGRKPKQTNA